MARLEMQQTERGLALLRIVFGLWMLREAVHHVVWTPWPWAAPGWVQVVTTQLAANSLDHPSFWVRAMVQQALLPNAELYAGATVVLSLLAGLSLTFGVLTVPGGLLAGLLALVGGTLSHYQGDLYLGYYTLQGVTSVVLAVTRSGRRWGGDVVFAGMRADSWLW